MSNLVVIAEAREGHVKKPSLEALGAAAALAAQSGDQVVALVAGAGLDAATDALANHGATRVIAFDSPALEKYSGDGYAERLVPKLRELEPTVVLMPNTAMGRDLAPRIAGMLEAGMVSDATALHFEDGRYGATKPVYAGKAYLKSFAKRLPFFATLRPNAFEPHAVSTAGTVEQAAVDADPASFRAIVRDVIAAASDRVPLQEAKVIVSGGRGLKEAEGFKLIEDLAAAFGPGVATVGASRAVVDAGWRPHREQVGQTGKVVAPTLYIAVGISGAIQHLAGMRTSRTIVAINKDANAPIFKVADYGLVGDAFEIVPALADAVRRAVAH